MSTTDTPLIPLSESRRFIEDCMVAVGASKTAATALANLLVEADYRGHYSHGMNRLEFYINDVRSGVCDGQATPVILKESPATAWVDGNYGLGAVVGNFCMDLAIGKAKRVGVGWVVAKGSTHYGMAGMYSVQAMNQGLIGMTFTNTSPILVPTRGKEAFFGSNPLSVAAPAQDGDSFVLDMATSVVALGKIEIQQRKGELIPEGWVQDTSGGPITDPQQALNASLLLPLGGVEKNSGYKGSGLAMMVELFCGILGGANYGPNIPRWMATTEKADLGQCFVAIDPECFAPGFQGRLQDLLDAIRHLEPVDPEKPVLVAGDPERNHMRQVDEAGGVRYVEDQLECCKRLAKELGVRPLRFL